MKRSSDQSRRLVHEQSESELQHGAATRIAPADETRVSRKIKSIIDNPKPKKICKNGPMSSEMAAQHDRNEENEEDEDERSDRSKRCQTSYQQRTRGYQSTS